MAFAWIDSCGGSGAIVSHYKAKMEGMRAFFSVFEPESEVIGITSGCLKASEAREMDRDAWTPASEEFLDRIGMRWVRVSEEKIPPLDWWIYGEKPYVLRARRLRKQGQNVPRYFVVRAGGKNQMTGYRVGDTRKLYRPMIDVYNIKGGPLLAGAKKEGAEITKDLRFSGGFRIERRTENWIELLDTKSRGNQTFGRQPSRIPREWWRAPR